MAQYDILIIQNVSAGGLDFKEIYIPKASNNGDVLTMTNIATGAMAWQTPSAGAHTQNTDTGTTSQTFTVYSGSTTGKLAIKGISGGAGDWTMTLQNATLGSANRTITLPDADGTVALTANNLSVFGATTSAQLAGVLSDETGYSAGAYAVFSISPVFGTSVVGGASFDVFDTVSTTINAFGAATTLAIGYDGTGAGCTTNINTGAATTGTKAINIGTGGVSSSTTTIDIGSIVSSTTYIRSTTISLGTSSAGATTVTLGGAITANTFKIAGTTSGTIHYTTDVTTGAVNFCASLTTGTLTFGGGGATTYAFAGTGAIVTIGSTSGTGTIRTGASVTTASVFDTVATTVNAFGAATTLSINTTATTTTTTASYSTGCTRVLTINVGSAATENTYTKTINIGTAGVAGSTTNVNIGSAVASAVLGTLSLNFPTILTANNNLSVDLWNTLSTTINFAGAVTTMTIGNTATAAQTVTMFGASTGASTYSIFGGATTTGNTKTVNIGANGATGSTTNINIGTGGAGTAIVNVNLGSASGGTVTVNKDLVVTGDLTVNGVTSTINATTLTVDDKNIELGSVASPSDTTADGGGITLKGTTDKTIIWDNANDNWTFNQAVNISSGLTYKINNTTVLQAYGASQIYFGNSSSAFSTLTVGASTIVGRKSSGEISALTAAEVMGILWQSVPGTKTSTGTAGWIAKDSNFLYVCVATDTWVRIAMATTW